MNCSWERKRLPYHGEVDNVIYLSRDVVKDLSLIEASLFHALGSWERANFFPLSPKGAKLPSPVLTCSKRVNTSRNDMSHSL